MASQIPQAPDVERNLIGAMLLPGAKGTSSAIACQLQDADFVDGRLVPVLHAIKEVLRSDMEPNPFTCREPLQRAGKLDQIGGVEFLLELSGGTLELSSYQPLVDTLHSKRRARELMRLGQDLHRNASEESSDPLELASEFQGRLKAVTCGAGKLDAENGSSILQEMAHFEPLGGLQGVEGGSWGDTSLDMWCPIPRGEYGVFGARPGVGKSTMMAQGAVASARRGLNVLALTMEMNRRKLKARVAANICGIPFGRILRGDYNAHDVARLGEHEDALSRIYYADPTNGTPWSKLESLIRYYVEHKGIDCVWLDQFDKIGRGDIKQGSSEAYAFGRVSEQIMACTKDLDIGFILLCQLKNESDAMPTLGSHADSDRPGKDSSVVVHLYRQGEKTRGIIQKNRDGGYVGHTFDVEIDGACQRLKVIERETEEPRQKRKGI